MQSFRFWHLLILPFIFLISSIGFAADTGPVKLTTELPSLDIIYNNSVVTIERVQDNQNTIKGTFAKTSRPCPPACITSIRPAEHIVVVGELELFEFMENQYLEDQGLIIDARDATLYRHATIPGSLSLPARDFSNLDNEKTNYLINLVNADERVDTGKFTQIMETFGLFADDLKTADFDFTKARKVLVWDSGPWSSDAHKIIAALLQTGYPEEYIYYYHGGMQSWLSLGLTIIKP